MAKTKTVFVCSECGYESSKWVGQCPSCKQWNTFRQFNIPKNTGSSNRSFTSKQSGPITLDKITTDKTERLKFNFDEFNRVLGNGMVPGTVSLMAGEPGVGKSTMLLQAILSLKGKKSLYCAGEESLEQVKLRASRVGSLNTEALFTDETDVDKYMKQVEETGAEIVIIDSIQTSFCNDIESVAGSVTQIRESAARIIKFAKSKQISFVLIGHITKSGNIAGPMILEHMVDVVMQFEGDRKNFFRILRARKNRFGTSDEIGVFEMNKGGLKEVKNPSDIFAGESSQNLSGIALASSLEGMRPMLIELQALVSSAVYGNPQRTSTGFDIRRINMILAVLEKRAGFKLNQKDVFVNIVGGLKLTDPGLDLPLAAAILSSDQDISIPKGTVLCGEIGLSGEVRPVSRIQQRISEAERLGLSKIIIPGFSDNNNKKNKIEITEVKTISEMMKKLFRN